MDLIKHRPDRAEPILPNMPNIPPRLDRARTPSTETPNSNPPAFGALRRLPRHRLPEEHRDLCSAPGPRAPASAGARQPPLATLDRPTLSGGIAQCDANLSATKKRM